MVKRFVALREVDGDAELSVKGMAWNSAQPRGWRLATWRSGKSGLCVAGAEITSNISPAEVCYSVLLHRQ